MTTHTTPTSDTESSGDLADLAAVEGFYRRLLSQPAELTDETLYSVLAEDYVSEPTPHAGPSAQGMFDSIKMFGQAVPDLDWEPQEIIRHDDRYTVRGRASGTAVAPFLGVENAAGKRFEIMSIDILTVADGRVVHAYHVEDWATAIAQLRAA